MTDLIDVIGSLRLNLSKKEEHVERPRRSFSLYLGNAPQIDYLSKYGRKQAFSAMSRKF